MALILMASQLAARALAITSSFLNKEEIGKVDLAKGVSPVARDLCCINLPLSKSHSTHPSLDMKDN